MTQVEHLEFIKDTWKIMQDLVTIIQDLPCLCITQQGLNQIMARNIHAKIFGKMLNLGNYFNVPAF